MLHLTFLAMKTRTKTERMLLKRLQQSWFYVKENKSARCVDSLKTMKEWENEK